MKSKIALNENVEYSKLHCVQCARNRNLCPKFGTPHGEPRSLFQPWGWVSRLIKNGYLSAQHVKLPIVFGYWTQTLKVSNLVVTAGSSTVPALLFGTGTVYGVYKYIAVGIGTGAAAAGDTGLGTEITDSGLARGTATVTAQTTDVTNDTGQLVLSFSVTGTKAVTESGVFNNIVVAQGTILARQVFSAINVVNGDTLQLTWKFDID